MRDVRKKDNSKHCNRERECTSLTAGFSHSALKKSGSSAKSGRRGEVGGATFATSAIIDGTTTIYLSFDVGIVVGDPTAQTNDSLAVG